MMKSKEFYGGGFRKALVVISLICLLVSFGAVSASAQSNTQIAGSSCTVERGDSASVAFNLEGNPGIWGLKLRIQYDHSALTLKSVTTGNVFEKDEFIFSENLDKDPYVVVASSNALENKTANGMIVTLHFTVSGDAAFDAYPVTVQISQAIDVDGDKISISAGNGSVTVVDTPATTPSESTGSTESSTTQTVKPTEGNHPNTGDPSSAALVTVIAMVALLAGGTVAFFGIKNRRGLSC